MVEPLQTFGGNPPPKLTNPWLSPEQGFRSRETTDPPLLFANVTLHEHSFTASFSVERDISAPGVSTWVELRDKNSFKSLLFEKHI